MTFIETTPEAEAAGAVAQMYHGDRELAGHLRNLAKAFSVAPEVYAVWQQLNASIKARMDVRRYELVTLAAARRLRSSYCSLSHGSVLLAEFVDAENLQEIMADHHGAGLEPVDIAVMDLADKIVVDASSVTQADVDRLRGFGLSDADVFDVVAAACARCFFSKMLDALGVQPDAEFKALDPALRETLTVGREIASA